MRIGSRNMNDQVGGIANISLDLLLHLYHAELEAKFPSYTKPDKWRFVARLKNAIDAYDAEKDAEKKR